MAEIKVKSESAMLNAHISALKQLKGRRVEVGWFDDTYPSGKSVADVMEINEYGAVINRDGKLTVIPARPWMRLAQENFRGKRKDVEKRVFTRLFNKEIKPREAMKQIAQAIKRSVVSSIRNGQWAPNAPSTIAKKGSDKPLIDTSQAVETVDFRII
jgi:hypothetical protein